MDDPIFDPWGPAVEPAPAPSPRAPVPEVPASQVPARQAPAHRWRSPLATSPTTPAAAPPRAPVRAPAAPAPAQRRLTGSAALLRTTAVPRLEQIALRLRMARHEAAVEDLLDESPARIRFSIRPWHLPLSRSPRPPWGRLEVTLSEGSGDTVLIRTRLDPTTPTTPDGPENPDGLEGEDRIPVSQLSAGRLEAVVLTFVGRLLHTA